MSPFFAGFLGALSALLVLAVLRRAAWRHFAHRRPFGPRRLLRRIGATPEQERAILAETDGLAEAVRSLRSDARALRVDLAELLVAPSLDAPRVGAALDARLAKVSELRGRIAAAVARIHEVLAPEQRLRLAEVVRSGPRGHCGRHADAHG